MLPSFIKSYAGTAAAKEAQQLLAKIK